ncbi:ribonucleoprotein RB97D-like [Rhopilema esculentum]|uniref:ribonucleoprotein RB97D-like n=1 Tax=Rhopilema esculentum TaxID=499914 RepID=UPI0031E1F6FF
MAGNNEQLQKIFVGGLNRDVDEKSLAETFRTYGRVVDVSVLKDSLGRSRGFGFVIFEGPSSVDDIMQAKKDGKNFFVNGGLVEVKRALPKVDRAEMKDRSSSRYSTSIGVKKIFVGGLASCTSSEHLESYFSKFGKVLESSVLMDKMTGKSRGFGFVVFEDEDAADKVCALRNHEICEKTCEVRKAEPRSALMNRKEREAVAAAGYRNQLDMTRQQQAPPTNSVDVNNLSSAIQVLNNLQNLLSAAQVQQMITPNPVVAAHQYPGLSYGNPQFVAPAQTVAAPSPVLNTNQGNILQLLQTALSNQQPQFGMPNQAVNTPSTSQLSQLLGSAGTNVNTLGLLSSLAGIGQQTNQVVKQDTVPQAVQNPALNTVPADGSTGSGQNFSYFEDSYGPSAQTTSGYGPVRYPQKSESKSYRPY